MRTLVQGEGGLSQRVRKRTRGGGGKKSGNFCVRTKWMAP